MTQTLFESDCDFKMIHRPDRSYILTGGLGGFGLALAKWLAAKGAKFLMITSKRGVRTGFQASQLTKILDEHAQVEDHHLQSFGQF